MAGKQRSVFLRFNMADESDCDLYMRLAEAAGSSASLTAYVKRAARQEFHAQMLSAVREEMQTQGMKLVGALLAGIGTVGVPVKRSEMEPAVTELPEACGELPQELNGVLDLIA